MPEAIVALGEQKIEVGRLHFESDGRRQHSTFIYSPSWLRNAGAFALAPGLPLGPGPIHASGQADTRDALPGAFADAAPDSWGRRLMARTLGEGLSEFDYLVRSDDVTRQGALRFLDERMEPLSQMTDPVPRRLDIEEIRAIAARYERDPLGAAEEARILAGAGGSLGGARPKANVIDGDQLWIAKFTAVGDTWPVERAEVAILNLGRALGLNTAVAELALTRSEAPVALIRRFDRRGQGRIPYMSARTALQVQGVTPGYYTDIADVIREISVDALADLRELWRRMILPDLGRLYEMIDAWIDRHRQRLVGVAADPGSFFVKTAKRTSTDAAYGQNTFYEAWRTAIQRYGIYNPWTGKGAIEGLLPHGPHNVRDVLATHILKQTGSYEQASYAIQDTPEMVAQHYGRFLPQDKAEIAARILNQVWAAA